MIEVDSLCRNYGPTRALVNVSFEVRKGEVLGFLGPNGAGKTTTMRILTCYIPATSGRATVAGFDVFEQPLEVRKRIGYLPEDTPLYMDMPVDSFLTFVAKMRGIERGHRVSKVGDVLERCALTDVRRKDIGKLSKGYRQRVGVAQAMIHDPDILILDEPTGGLDPSQIVEIRALIKRLGKEKTVILCTHILPEVQATCDRVIIINRGVIVAEGTTEELGERARGGRTVVMELRGLPGQIDAKVAAVPYVKSCKREKADGENLWKLTITLADKEDHNEDLFRWVVANGWTLRQLRHESASLEDVFLHLTTREKH